MVNCRLPSHSYIFSNMQFMTPILYYHLGFITHRLFFLGTLYPLLFCQWGHFNLYDIIVQGLCLDGPCWSVLFRSITSSSFQHCINTTIESPFYPTMIHSCLNSRIRVSRHPFWDINEVLGFFTSSSRIPSSSETFWSLQPI